MATYTFPTSALVASANGKIQPSMLVGELFAALGVRPITIDEKPATQELVLMFESAVNETTLASVIAAHLGVKTEVKFHASSKIVDEETAVLTSAWSTIGGIVTNIGFFIPNLAAALGRVVGEYKAVGTGAQLRVIEVGADGTEVEIMTPPKDLADTADVWTKTKFTCVNTPPRSGDSTFRLEGRLNGATSASVRFLSMSLLEIKNV
jgi:hypothetical protein